MMTVEMALNGFGFDGNADAPWNAAANSIIRHPVSEGISDQISVNSGGVTIWHDGGCPLCAREIALMRRIDRRGAITFIDATAPDTACPIDRRSLLRRFHARENGQLLSGAAAFAAMWRAIPLLRPLGLLARHPLMLRVLERGYLAFLRVRPRLQARLRRTDAS